MRNSFKIKLYFSVISISYVLSILLTGCVNASTFGMSEDVYKRNLLSIKNKTTPFTMKLIPWTGSPANIGKEKAVYVKNNPEFIQRLSDSMSLGGIKPGNHEKVYNNFNKFFPEMLEEIKSFSDIYGYPLDELMKFYGAGFSIGGCSIYINSLPEPFLARNYDWAPALTDGIISSTAASKGKFASIHISEAIFGALSGINEKGLAIAISGINSSRKFPDKGGFSVPVIVRGILDKAEDVTTAIALLEKIPHTTSCSYSLLDSSGNMAVAEVGADNISVRKSSGNNRFLTAANHFQSLSNRIEEVKVLPNSLKRVEKIEAFHRKNPDADIDSVFRFMGDPEKGPALSNYSLLLGTMWTIVYLPQKQEMIIRIGLNGDKKIFSPGQKKEAGLKGNLKDLPPRFSDYF